MISSKPTSFQQMKFAIPQHIIEKLSKMDRSQNNIMKSQLRFTVTQQSKPQPQHRNSANLTKDVSDEIFRKSINASSIGKMSGNTAIAEKFQVERKSLKDIIEIDEDEEQQAEPAPTMRRSKRKNFSIQFQSIKRSKFVSEEESKYLQLVSMIDRDGKDYIQKNGCTACGQDFQPKVCMIVLENESTMLIYRPDEKKQFTVLFFSLNFDTVLAQVQRSTDSQTKQIAINVGNCNLILAHESRTVINKWYDALQQMQKQSKGKFYGLDSFSQIPNFYNIRYQTESFFTQNCQTGDIILFEDSHFFAKAQRFITDSDFDHVAMVIRDTQHGILLFQSNSANGVSLLPWKYVIKFEWYKSIPRIVWRRLLDIRRTKEFNGILEKFVMQNMSKNYHLNLDKLMMKTSMLRNENKTDQEQKEEHGYFCSQLIATLYKDLSLLTRDTNNSNYKPGCNFYPKDFSQRNGRNLDKGRLSPEYQIFFDERQIEHRYLLK